MLRRNFVAAKSFLSADRAVAITEYGILVAFIALIVIAVMILFGGGISSWFGTKTSAITTN